MQFASTTDACFHGPVERTLSPMYRFVMLSLLALAPVHGGDWGPLEFLIGKWVGSGDGRPGQGSGAFSFTPDLQDNVLVRRSFAEYPPANGKPGFRHDDLMIVYRDGSPDRFRAIYFDSEEHTIQYSVKGVAGAVVFESAGAAGGPRYRMTYTPAGEGRAKFKFEIAPPGQDFATYIEADLHREKP